MNAFPGLMGRLDAASAQAAGVLLQAMPSGVPSTATDQIGAMMMQRGQMGVVQSSGQASSTMATPATASTVVTPQAQTGSMAGMSAGQTGCTMMQSGQMGTVMMQSGQAPNAQTTESVSGVVGKIQSMAQRVRERIAGRLGAANAGSTPSMTTSPSAAAAVSPCPMMGTMVPSTASAGSAQGAVSSSEVGNPDDFGTLTISLFGAAPTASANTAAGGQRLVDWLERLVQVLELKLAAMS